MGTRGTGSRPTTDGPVETSSGLRDAQGSPTAGGVNPKTQRDLTAPSQPQDTYDTRAKNSRHGKVTSDKWNQ